jgi:hypothetical protein
MAAHSTAYALRACLDRGDRVDIGVSHELYMLELAILVDTTDQYARDRDMEALSNVYVALGAEMTDSVRDAYNRAQA